MPRLELFPFRYRDRLTGKWVKARYVAERHEIAARYGEWQIIGPPEIRDVDTHARYFTPWKVVPHAELMRISEPTPEVQPPLAAPPAIDGLESFLVGVFLRRYVTYRARRGDAQTNGAARLSVLQQSKVPTPNSLWRPYCGAVLRLLRAPACELTSRVVQLLK